MAWRKLRENDISMLLTLSILLKIRARTQIRIAIVSVRRE
jgi:hypothetical protein